MRKGLAMRFLTLGFTIIALALSSCLAFGLEDSSPEVACSKCHGFPPGTGPMDIFNPGAHLTHQKLFCSECHTEGGDEQHINGSISIDPNCGYTLGPAIPWPSETRGSCGGNASPLLPAGCHVDMREKECLWLPGDVCKVPESSPVK